MRLWLLVAATQLSEMLAIILGQSMVYLTANLTGHATVYSMAYYQMQSIVDLQAYSVVHALAYVVVN